MGIHRARLPTSKDIPKSRGDALYYRYSSESNRSAAFPVSRLQDNLAAHFRDIVDGELEGDESGYRMAAWIEVRELSSCCPPPHPAQP